METGANYYGQSLKGFLGLANWYSMSGDNTLQRMSPSHVRSTPLVIQLQTI